MLDSSAGGTNSRKLFVYASHEKKRLIDQTLENCYEKILLLTKSDPTGEELNQYTLISAQHREEIIFGYLYGILIDRQSADEYFRCILLHSSDHFESAARISSELIVNDIHQLQPECVLQMCWFIEQGVRSGIKRLSSLIHQLLRELQLLPIEVVNRVIKIFEENTGWVMSTSILSGMVVYTLIPLIRRYDSWDELDRRMIDLCTRLIRQRWMECSRIGRDFIRALNSVVIHKPFFNLWQDILKGNVLDQMDNQIEQIMYQRTQKKFLLSRLTHRMERMILFLLNEVKLNDDISFYKDWLQRNMSVANRIDLIRYLCSPACEVTSGTDNPVSNRDDVRKHLLYWLVVSIEAVPSVTAIDVLNVRVALLFDWLMYQPNRHQSIDPSIVICFNWSIQYLTHLSRHFVPCLEFRLVESVKKFIELMWGNSNPDTGNDRLPVDENQHFGLEGQAIPTSHSNPLTGTIPPWESSHDYILDDVECGDSIDVMPATINGLFSAGFSEEIEFSSSDDEQTEIVIVENGESTPRSSITRPCGGQTREGAVSYGEVVTENEGNEGPQGKIACNGDRRNTRDNRRLLLCPPTHDSDYSALKACLRLLPKLYGRHARKVTTSKSRKDRSNSLRQFIQNLSSIQKRAYCEDCSAASSIDRLPSNELNSLATLLLHLMRYSLHAPLMPPPAEGYEDEVSSTHCNKVIVISKRISKRPLFLFFERVCIEPSLIPLLGSMYSMQPKIGYLFLLYLYVRNPEDSDYERDAQIFRSLFDISDGDGDHLVEKAMTDCHRDEIDLFFFLLPFAAAGCQAEKPASKAIARSFSHHEGQEPLLPLNSLSILKLIVSTANSVTLNDLACRLCTGEVVFFDEDRTLRGLIKSTSQWTPFERSNMWVLLQAQLPHSIVAAQFRSVRSDHVASQIVAQHILCSGLRLGHVRSVLSRQPPDMYTKMIIARWCDDDTLKDFIDYFTAVVGSLKRVRRAFPSRKLVRKRRKRVTSHSDSGSTNTLPAGIMDGAASDTCTSTSTSDSESLYSSDEERNPSRANNIHRLNLGKILDHLDKMRIENNSDCLRFLVDRSVCCSVCQATAVVGLSDEQLKQYEELLQLMKDFSKENEVKSTDRRRARSRPQSDAVGSYSQELAASGRGAQGGSQDRKARSSKGGGARPVKGPNAGTTNPEVYGWKPAIRRTPNVADSSGDVLLHSSSSESSSNA